MKAQMYRSWREELTASICADSAKFKEIFYEKIALLTFFSFFTASYLQAQDIDDFYIGKLYIVKENKELTSQNRGFNHIGDFDFESFVKDFGLPDSYTPLDESRTPLPDNGKRAFSATYLSQDGKYDTLFFENNELCGYNVYSRRFAIAKKLFDGGIRIGDPISKVKALFGKSDHFICETSGLIVTYTDKTNESTSNDSPNFWLYEGDYPIAMIINNDTISYLGLYVNEY